ncbi:unnamed protein product, partial [Hapterophycus canaliculatus]
FLCTCASDGGGSLPCMLGSHGERKQWMKLCKVLGCRVDICDEYWRLTGRAKHSPPADERRHPHVLSGREKGALGGAFHQDVLQTSRTKARGNRSFVGGGNKRSCA